MPRLGDKLFRILNGLRHFGVGAAVTRATYKFPDTYWVITRVKLSKDQNHGKAYGRLIWRGKAKDSDSSMGSSNKSEWKLVSLPDYRSFKNPVEQTHELFATKTERTC